MFRNSYFEESTHHYRTLLVSCLPLYTPSVTNNAVAHSPLFLFQPTLRFPRRRQQTPPAHEQHGTGQGWGCRPLRGSLRGKARKSEWRTGRASFNFQRWGVGVDLLRYVTLTRARMSLEDQTKWPCYYRARLTRKSTWRSSPAAASLSCSVCPAPSLRAAPRRTCQVGPRADRPPSSNSATIQEQAQLGTLHCNFFQGTSVPPTNSSLPV